MEKPSSAAALKAVNLMSRIRSHLEQQPEEFRWHFPEGSRGDQQLNRASTSTGPALQLDALNVVFQYIGLCGEQLLKRLRKASYEE